MAYSEEIAARVRQAVADLLGCSERRMFGGLCFMVNGNMFAGVVADELMLRVGPEGFGAALLRPGARPMDFTGRPMTGMVYVEPAGFANPEALGAWLDEALAFAGRLPPRTAGSRKRTHQT